MEIRFKDSSGTVRDVTAKASGMVIGSDVACDIVIQDPSVSGRHCKVLQENGSWVVEDLGSASGVLVNGERIMGQSALEPGDSVAIGDTVFGMADAAPPPEKPVKPAIEAKEKKAKVPASSRPVPPPPDKPATMPAPAALPVPPVLKTFIWTNAVLVVMIICFAGYLAKTVWLKEKSVWVLPCGTADELVTDDGQGISGPELLPVSSSLTLKKTGFEDRTIPLSSLKSVTSSDLAPAPGTVLLTSTPPGIPVFHGGSCLGRTPCAVTDLPPGVHLLHAGGLVTRRKVISIEVRKDRGGIVDVPVEGLLSTLLVVTTTPGCGVTVNGTPVGKTKGEKGQPEPLTLKNMLPGSYVIRATTPKGKAKETIVTVGEQQYRQISIAL